MFNPGLETGFEIDNKKLCDIFKCGPQGGMRKSNKTGTLVIVSNHIKSIYDDRWIDEVFHYTGMGQKGDQRIDFMQNKTLAESETNGIGIYLFEVFEPQVYTYVGPMMLSDKPYTETQPDEDGINRNVWMFPLVPRGQNALVVPKKRVDDLFEKKAIKARRLSDYELKKRAENSSKKVGSRKVQTNQYERNIWVSEFIKRMANGICQLCNSYGPFLDKNGNHYLETHHIIWLSKGGEDTIENTVALCPNCHRRMHVLDDPQDIKKLSHQSFL
jgi:5-methylcytosine-specific restriction protein A